ncbi:MAG: NADH-quinone oxidoreductase subunit N [Acidimicrobiales bacterium]
MIDVLAAPTQQPVTVTAAADASTEVVWSLLWPLVILAGAGVLLVTITSLSARLRRNGFPALFTATAAVAAAVSAVPIWNRIVSLDLNEGPRLLVSGSLAADGFGLFVTVVICAAVFITALLLDDYLPREGLDGPEWYVLLLLSASGGILLATATDLILTFVGLEILSIAVYVLAAMHLRRMESQEAGFKYFILGALSSAIFLYGIALIYGATGSTSLAGIAAAGVNQAGLDPAADSSLLLAGMALLLVGFAFKVSAAPFHVWTPDVYQGAPTPIVAYMASGVKVAGFAGMARVLVAGLDRYNADWRPLVFGLAALTLLIGALLAIVQRNVKRMLAYSSIAHAGFMLIAVYVMGSPGGPAFGNPVAVLGSQSLLFYMVAYTFMAAGTFGVMTAVGGRGDAHHDLSSYQGLARRSPLLAGMMAVLLFGQAGIPFTSGFFAKFRVIGAAVANESYVLAGLAMLTSVAAAVLYLRVVVAMFMTEPDAAYAATDAATPAVDDPAADEPAGDDPAVEELEASLASDEAARLGDLEEAADDVIAAEEPMGPTEIEPGLAVMVAVAICAGATLALGLFPDLGGGVLREAASSLLTF